MKIYEDRMRQMNGYLEGKIDAIDIETSSKALSYKKNFLKQFIAIYPQIIDSRLGDSRYYVTRKYDGEFATIVYDNGRVVTINRSGRTRIGLPCAEEAARLLKKAGVTQAIIPAEIYVDDRDKRTRTHDLLHALSKKGDVSGLHLAAFDILELDNQPYKPDNYIETHEQIVKWFARGKLVKPVEMEVATSSRQVKDLYRRWVDEGTAEGLVVRSDLPFVFKIKPRHYIDAVVIGYTEGTGNQQGQVRTFLVAMMAEEGLYQVVGHVGGGMKDELKTSMFDHLEERIVTSDYIETDSNHVAFRMVDPVTVMEFSVRDVIYETANGAVTNPVLRFEDGGWYFDRTVTGLSFIAPVFEKFREDKAANAVDIRLSQIEDFASFEREEIVDGAPAEKSPSEVLLREVYHKTLGEKYMIQKYVVWKTNKESAGDYPAYVLHYTNYSSNRRDQLQRELRVSDSEEQIMELYRTMLGENLKKGWEKVALEVEATV
ncbi:MAG: hypothetical protein LUE26_07540 [Alistipes sp.]|nr:hypothetical protein [Alistipes sp.]